jgi:hypothetical protein
MRASVLRPKGLDFSGQLLASHRGQPSLRALASCPNLSVGPLDLISQSVAFSRNSTTVPQLTRCSLASVCSPSHNHIEARFGAAMSLPARWRELIEIRVRNQTSAATSGPQGRSVQSKADPRTDL